MAKLESTAINDLIERVATKPIDRESDEELLFRAPPNTSRALDSIPPLRRRAGSGTPASPYESVRVRELPTLRAPDAAPLAREDRNVARPRPQQAASIRLAPQPARPRAPQPPPEEDTEIGTIPYMPQPQAARPRAQAAAPRAQAAERPPAREARRPQPAPLASPPPAFSGRPAPQAAPLSVPRAASPPSPVSWPPPPRAVRLPAPFRRAIHALPFDEAAVATVPIRRTALRARIAQPLPMALLSIGGVMLGLAGYRALTNRETTTLMQVGVTAGAAVAAPEPSARPVLAPSPAPSATRAALESAAAAITTPRSPALVELQLESDPAGASVTLVDGGRASLLGTTPLNASFDPSRAYDLQFTLEGRPARVEHVDPRATHHLAVTFEAPAVAEVTPAPAPVPAERPRHVARARPTVAEAPSGAGVLMVSSKPPCAILVDGRSTGLTTPQRSVSLPSGTHTITLINANQKIKRSFPVKIEPNHATKLIRDLMKA